MLFVKCLVKKYFLYFCLTLNYYPTCIIFRLYKNKKNRRNKMIAKKAVGGMELYLKKIF